MGSAAILQQRLEHKKIWTVLAELIYYSSIKLPLGDRTQKIHWLTYCTADARLKGATFEKTSPI